MKKNNPCSDCELKARCKEAYPYEARERNKLPFDRKKEGKCLKIQINTPQQSKTSDSLLPVLELVEAVRTVEPMYSK